MGTLYQTWLGPVWIRSEQAPADHNVGPARHNSVKTTSIFELNEDASAGAAEVSL